MSIDKLFLVCTWEAREPSKLLLWNNSVLKDTQLCSSVVHGRVGHCSGLFLCGVIGTRWKGGCVCVNEHPSFSSPHKLNQSTQSKKSSRAGWWNCGRILADGLNHVTRPLGRPLHIWHSVCLLLSLKLSACFFVDPPLSKHTDQAETL